MNDSYKSAFSKVPFSADFEDRAKAAMQKAAQTKQEKGRAKRILLIGIGLVACLALTLLLPGLMGVYKSIVACRVVLSINPSVEFRLNKDGELLGVSGLNDDGTKLIEGLDFTGLSYENATILVVNRLIADGYISASIVQDEIQLSVSGNSAQADTLGVMTKVIQSAAAQFELIVDASATDANDVQIVLRSPQAPISDTVRQPSVLRVKYLYESETTVESIVLYPDDQEKITNLEDFAGMEVTLATFFATHEMIQRGYISDKAVGTKVIYEISGYGNAVFSKNLKLIRLMVQEAGLSLNVTRTGKGRITITKSKSAAPARMAKYTMAEILNPYISKDKSDFTGLQIEILSTVFPENELIGFWTKKYWAVVPNVVGMTEEQAWKLCKQAGIEPSYTHWSYTESLPKDDADKVIRQDPIAGSTCQIGSRFVLMAQLPSADAPIPAPPVSVEERTLKALGLSYPFDYSDKQKAIDAGFVVVTGGQTVHGDKLHQLVAAQGYVDQNVIVARYDGDAVQCIYALFARFGHLECEAIQNGRRSYYVLGNVQFENGAVYAVPSQESTMLLAEDVPVTSVGLSYQLKYINDIHAKISYLLAPTFNKKLETKAVSITISRLIDLLSSQTLIAEKLKDNDAFTVLVIRGNCNGFICDLRSDGGVVFRCGNYRFVSYSKTLYDGIFKLSGVEQFNLRSVEGARSMTIKQRQANGKIRTIKITNETMVGTLVGLLKKAKYIESSDYFIEPDVEITLHTPDGDVVGYLYGVCDEEWDPENTIVFGRFHFFASKDAAQFIRGLLP